ncbi:hypothetical protein FGG08_002653 [Glutinoglossum americanum]|uniref:Uncharacterized protein n=1 Tax=Glutinoglossum americanum TaxID=1670608 RepID=A0A9P8L1E8_9PEZI|nr:hypothetical protein FGG08_002653 [Glutinoglossum americanum]
MDEMELYADERYVLPPADDRSGASSSVSSRSSSRSPLILLPMITEPLDYPQWCNRVSSLKDRFRYEDPQGCTRDVVSKVFQTLRDLCIGNEAEESLSRFVGVPSSLNAQSTNSSRRLISAQLSSPIGSASKCYTTRTMEELVDLSDSAGNTAKDPTAVPSASPTTTLRLHSSTRNQHGSSLEGSSLPHRVATPRYMSPTIASMSQASTAPATQAETRSTTPTHGSASLKAIKARNWLTTAMSLSGFGRSGDGAPRGKRDRVVSHSSDNTKDHTGNLRPEHLDKTSPGGLQKTRGALHLELSKALPTEKALPSPPVAQILTAETPVVRRGLLDASDLPLRRSPPDKAGDPNETEDWPVLLPRNAAGAAMIQQFAQEDDSGPDSPCAGVKLNGDQWPEKVTRSADSLPPHASTAMGSRNVDRKAAAGSAAVRVQRKPVPRATHQTIKHIKDPLRDMTPGATTIKKPNGGTARLDNCGRARRSSLRIPIPVGSLSTDLGAKVVGPTGFAAGRLVDLKPLSGVSGNIDRPTSRARTMDKLSRLPTKSAGTHHYPAINAGAQVIRAVSQSPSPNHIVGQGRLKDGTITRTMRATSENMDGQQKENMVRKDAVGARGDLGDDMASHDRREPKVGDFVDACDKPSTLSLDVSTRASVVDGQPRQLAKHIDPDAYDSKLHEKKPAASRASLSSGQRPSSIPTFRKATSPLSPSLERETEAISFKKHARTARNSFSIFEDEQIAGDADVDTDDVVSLGGVAVADTEAPTVQVARTSQISRGLGRKVKTPSKNLPQLGPVLRISPAADTIIMGQSGKENRSPNSGQVSPALRRAVVMNELRKSSKHLDKYFAKEPGKQSATTDRKASSEKPLSRPKSAGCDLKQICSFATARGQKSWSMDAATLILKKGKTPVGEAVVTGLGSRHDDPFTEFQQELMRKNRGLAEPQARVHLQDNHEDSKHTLGTSGIDSGKPAETIGRIEPQTKAAGVDASALSSRGKNPTTAPRAALRPRAPHAHIDGSSGMTSVRNALPAGVKLSGNRPKGNRVAHRPQPMPLQHTPASVSSSNSIRPPRTSSRVAVPDYTTRSSPVAGITNKSSISPQPPPKDFVEVQNRLGSSRGIGSTPLVISAPGTFAPPMRTKAADGKRSSDASKISQTPSTKILAMTKIRGLFRKNISPIDKKSTLKKGKKFMVTDEGSPLVSPVSDSATAGKQEPKLRQDAGSSGPNPHARPADLVSASFPTPGPTPARPSEIAETNALAMSLLNSARHEPDSPKKERLLALGKAMVDSITNARDAEKAMEEAKMAATNAEMFYMMAKRSVLDVTNMVREWKENEA